MAITRIITIVLILLFSWLLFTVAKNAIIISTASDHYKLLSVINGEHRMESNKARDKYRHPQQTLTFFGINSDMSIIEVWPGKGWYTEILAPFIKSGEGQFTAAGFPKSTGPEWSQNMARDYLQWLQQSPELYGNVNIVELGSPTHWEIAPNESVDAILTFRNVHNWVKAGYEEEVFTSFYSALKPGGILGVTDHRAQPSTDLETMKKSGYLTEELVVSLAKQAGFVLEETSEINANPLDNTQHPKGVWTLPPTLRLGDENREKYLAIGESDRMTLRFRKPDKL